jgi:hypothetical protein
MRREAETKTGDGVTIAVRPEPEDAKVRRRSRRSYGTFRMTLSLDGSGLNCYWILWRALYRKQVIRWSLTIPTACMNA